MLPARQLLSEIVTSLRTVIAPAIAEPYPKAQVYMAAVILDFISRQVEERSDIAAGKQDALAALFHEVSQLPGGGRIAGDLAPTEAGLCELIEKLYAQREILGEEAFTAANQVVRRTLRELLDQELKVAGAARD